MENTAVLTQPAIRKEFLLAGKNNIEEKINDG